MPGSSGFRLFAGKVILITGAANDAGRMMARELASLGASLALVDMDEQALLDLTREIEAATNAPARLTIHPCDIRKEDQIAGLLDQVLLTHGSIDGLVNDAGGFSRRSLAEAGAAGIEAMVEATLRCCLSMMQQVFTRWMTAHGGVIVNVISGIWMPHEYSRDLTVAGLIMQTLTESAGAEWFSAGVRVNCVAPSPVAQPQHAQSPTESERTSVDEPEGGNERASCLSDAASAIVWLLSPSASQTTGCSIKVGTVPMIEGGADGGSRFNCYPTAQSVH